MLRFVCAAQVDRYVCFGSIAVAGNAAVGDRSGSRTDSRETFVQLRSSVDVRPCERFLVGAVVRDR